LLNFQHTTGKLLILLAIADFADNGEAWPSIPTLARKSRLKERQTQYAIKSLVRSGELKVSKNKGPRGCHLYHIVILDDAKGPNIAPVQEMLSAVDGTLGVQWSAPEPSRNRHVQNAKEEW
jgi:Helix-turn-helix domain